MMIVYKQVSFAAYESTYVFAISRLWYLVKRDKTNIKVSYNASPTYNFKSNKFCYNCFDNPL